MSDSDSPAPTPACKNLSRAWPRPPQRGTLLSSGPRISSTPSVTPSSSSSSSSLAVSRVLPPPFVAPEEFLNMWSPPKVLYDIWEINLVKAVFKHTEEDGCNARRYRFVAAWLKALDRVKDENEKNNIRINGSCFIGTIKECWKTLYAEDGKFIPITIQTLAERHCRVGGFANFLQDTYSFLRSSKRASASADTKKAAMEGELALHAERIEGLEGLAARVLLLEAQIDKLVAKNAELTKQLTDIVTEGYRTQNQNMELHTKYAALVERVLKVLDDAAERKRRDEGNNRSLYK